MWIVIWFLAFYEWKGYYILWNEKPYYLCSENAITYAMKSLLLMLKGYNIYEKTLAFD